jgi:hypothetical protein
MSFGFDLGEGMVRRLLPFISIEFVKKYFEIILEMTRYWSIWMLTFLNIQYMTMTLNMVAC